ncbi:transposase zinc-binding domain-containing protein [Acetivibrio clariflavus]|uniref:transposase zinc-binding domain-containing protein n=1 Tax=Acetivibrio clariflavus TaxID=288965 RepID=UPI003B82D1D8
MLGFYYFFCEHCGTVNKFFHTCKSRFCNFCGVKYAKERAVAISSKCINCSIVILCSLSLKNYNYFFVKTEPFLTYCLKLPAKQFCLGFMI